MATEMGPLCTERQRLRLDEIVRASIQAGAKVLCGGAIPAGAGSFYPPTILDCTDAPEAPCVTEELFGPVLSVLRFSDEAEAVRISNATRYGLAAALDFTTIKTVWLRTSDAPIPDPFVMR